MEEKKLRKSGIVIALYVLAGLVMIFVITLIGQSISYINAQYAQYSMTPQFGNTLQYVIQNTLLPFGVAVLMAAAGCILNEVRALNPAYYATDAEIAAAKAAKLAAKAADAEKKVAETAEQAAEAEVKEAEKAGEFEAEDPAEAENPVEEA